MLDDFSPIKSITNTYFYVVEESDSLSYWDSWELNGQSSNIIGSTRMSIDVGNWFPKLYLASLIYLLGREQQNSLSTSEPEELPFPTNRESLRTIEELGKKIIPEFVNNSYLEFFDANEENINKRLKMLSRSLSQSSSYAEKQKVARIRSHPIDLDLYNNWRENKQFIQ